MTQITDIKLRQLTHTDLSTKGSELTFTEEDTNFIAIYNALKAVNNGSGLSPYSSLTNYTGTVYVSYAGNIYKHIASSSTGATPDANPTIWQLSSVGELVHQQGTDMTVGGGSAYMTTAQQLFDLVNNKTTSVTSAQFATAVSAGTLKVNHIYIITDVVNVQSLIVHTTGAKSFATGVAMVKRSNVKNWEHDRTYSVDDVVFWLGLHYSNKTGDNGDLESSPFEDSVNWGVMTSPDGFVSLPMICDFYVSASSIVITKLSCPFTGNKFGKNAILNSYFPTLADNTLTGIPANVFETHFEDDSAATDFFHIRGKVQGCTLKNASLLTALNSYGIKTNFIGVYLDNSQIDMNYIPSLVSEGSLLNIRSKNAYIAIPRGLETGNVLSTGIIEFSGEQKYIEIPRELTVAYFNINDNGSSIEASADMTGFPPDIIMTDVIGYPEISCYGIIGIHDDAFDRDISSFRFPTSQKLPVVLRPDTVTRVKIMGIKESPSDVSSDYQFVLDYGLREAMGNPTEFIIDGSTRDDITIFPEEYGSLTFWRIIKIRKSA